MTPRLSDATRAARTKLIELGHRYHRAGWLFGTSGNLSAKVGDGAETRVVVSASGRDKGHLGLEDFVELDLAGTLLGAGRDDDPADLLRTPDEPGDASPSAGAGPGQPASGRPSVGSCRPSAEATIHLALYRTRPDARVALHVHTVASTLARATSQFPAVGAPVARLTFSGIELIKGWDLWDEDVVAHLPVFDNHPDVPRIASDIEAFYQVHPNEKVPALLIASHGITAWGKDAFSANRHLEVTEFLCQIANALVRGR